MPGELVPLVLLPRYTTFAGVDDFVTLAMDVTDYSSAIVNLWRGKLLGTNPTMTVLLEESSDQVTWFTCSGGSTPALVEDDEVQRVATLNKRWFRIKVTLGGTSSPVGTCWAVGFLERRLS